MSMAGTQPVYNAWDPTHKGDHFTLTNQNRTAANDIPTPSNGTVLSVYGKSSGVYQCEHTIDIYPSVGMIELGVAYQTVNLNNHLGAVEDMWTWIGTSVGGGQKSNHVGQTGWTSGNFVVGDVLGVVVSIGLNLLNFYKNGTLLALGGGASSIMQTAAGDPFYGPFAGTVYWAFKSFHNVDQNPTQVTSNFGHTAFAYPVVGAVPMHGPTT